MSNKNIKIDYKTSINYKNILNKKLCGTSKYPIVIEKSNIGYIEAKEGCKIYDSIISNNVILGKFVSVNGPATRISSYGKIKIGSYSSIASNVVIQEYYHKYNRISSYYVNNNILRESNKGDIYSKGDIIIEEDVWIGSNCVILSGINIGRGSVIGAGSIVTKSIPRYSIVVGNPAKVIRQRFSSEIIEILEHLKWWEWNTEKIIKHKDIFNIEEEKILLEKLQELLNEQKKHENNCNNCC